MFNRRKGSLCYIHTDDGVLEMSQATYDYIQSLKKELRDTKGELIKVQAELKALKPVITNKDWKPAMSSDCGECKYVVRSRWNSDIIGCRKDCVCNDFAKED